jgi:hypothetical protein
MVPTVLLLLILAAMCMGQVSPIPSLPLPRKWAESFAIGNKVYLVGGSDGVNDSTTMDIFNSSTGLWYTLSGSPQLRPRIAHCVVTWGTLAIIAGGSPTGPGNWQEVDVFDSTSETFVNLLNLSVARTDMACGLVGDVALLAGGADATGTASTLIERFSFTSQNWLPSGNLAQAREGAVFVSNGANLGAIAAGQASNGTVLNSVEVYDSATGLVNPAASLSNVGGPLLCGGMAAGYLWFVGGSTGSSSGRYAEPYYASNMSKVPGVAQPALPFAVTLAHATEVAGSKLFFGTSLLGADIVQYIYGLQLPAGIVQFGYLNLSAPLGTFERSNVQTLLGTNTVLMMGGGTGPIETNLTMAFDCSAPNSCVVDYATAPPTTPPPPTTGPAPGTSTPPAVASTTPIATVATSPPPVTTTLLPLASSSTPQASLPVASTNLLQAPPQAVPLALQAANGQPVSFASGSAVVLLQVELGMRIEEISKPSNTRVASLLVQMVNGTVTSQTTLSYRRIDITGQVLSNGASLDLTVWSFTQDSQLLVGGVPTNFSSNTVKHQATITRWPFRNASNELEIEAVTQLSGDSVTAFLVEQTSAQQGDPIVTYSLNSGMRMQVLTRLGGSLDGQNTRFAYRLGTSGNVTLRVPYFASSVTVDPSFQIFMQDNSASTRPGAAASSSGGGFPMMAIIGASSGGSVALIIVIVAVALLAMRLSCPHKLPRWMYNANVRETDVDMIQRGNGGSGVPYQRMVGYDA